MTLFLNLIVKTETIVNVCCGSYFIPIREVFFAGGKIFHIIFIYLFFIPCLFSNSKHLTVCHAKLIAHILTDFMSCVFVYTSRSLESRLQGRR